MKDLYFDLSKEERIKITEEIREKLDFTWIDHPETDRAISIRDFLIENPNFNMDIFSSGEMYKTKIVM
jgi:hypothetical protein